MILQFLVIALVCVAAAMLALSITWVSLSALGKLLKRADQSREEQQL
jgi:hypothetical protein